uniref:Uncharacterized protein n=1 Tax=Anguilla anguilla TaxID=7936 RepID=A0A0E9Q3F7_ANGAN
MKLQLCCIVCPIIHFNEKNSGYTMLRDRFSKIQKH